MGKSFTISEWRSLIASPESRSAHYTGAMSPASEVQIIPLVPNIELPRRASPRTRLVIPSGYGVQEQCLPFTAASGLGLLIPSPITFGYCPVNEVPEGCRAFRSPLKSEGPQADWVFYVQDNPQSNFAGNAYTFSGFASGPVLEPGISFFDREDQQHLFKLHLPYVWRTPRDVDTLFLPLLNKTAPGVEVQSGLVETDWYANPVNMILRQAAAPVHFRAGEEIAQAISISRQQRHPEVLVATSHSRLTRETQKAFLEWHVHRAKDRSAYKILARSHHGRID